MARAGRAYGRASERASAILRPRRSTEETDWWRSGGRSIFLAANASSIGGAGADLHADEVAVGGRAGLRAGDKEAAIWAVH